MPSDQNPEALARTEGLARGSGGGGGAVRGDDEVVEIEEDYSPRL